MNQEGQYLVCEMTEDGYVAFVVDHCRTRGEATLRVAVHRLEPPGSIHHVDGPICVYQRIYTNPVRRGDA